MRFEANNIRLETLELVENKPAYEKAIDLEDQGDQMDDSSVVKERLGEHFLKSKEANLLKRLIRGSKQLEDKIFQLEKEIKKRIKLQVIEVKINDLHPNEYLLCATHVAKMVMD